MKGKRFTEQEDDFIRENYQTMSDEEIGKVLGRTGKSIQSRRNKSLKLSIRNDCWTKKEIEFLQDNYKTMEYKELSIYLNRTKSAISNRVRILGLQRVVSEITDEIKEEIIKKHLNGEKLKLISSEMGISETRIIKLLDNNNLHIHKHKFWDIREIEKFLFQEGFELISQECENVLSKIYFKDINGFIYTSNMHDLQNSKRRSIVHKANPHSISNIKLWLYINDSQLELLSKKYEGMHEKLCFKCLSEGCNRIFYASWANIFSGNGCPFCKESKGEKKISQILLINNINFIPQKTFDNLVGVGGGSLSYDFYLPKSLLIEYQGEQHDRPIDFNGLGKEDAINQFKKQQEHDRRKRQYAKDNGIELLEIWYWDYDNIEKILSDKLKI